MGWVEKRDKLVKEYQFNDFKEAWEFLTKVASLAEKHNHHPEIYNVYNRVVLKLQTHDAGNVVTDKDRDLAKAIDESF